MYWRRRLSRLELAVYSVVVGLLMVVFLDRALETMELAERAAMESTITRLNSAIRLHIARETLSGRPPDAGALKTINPFALAEAVAPNLAAGTRALEPGQWAFDEARTELVYRARLTRFLATADGGDQLRFHLAPTLVLVPTSSYAWGAP